MNMGEGWSDEDETPWRHSDENDGRSMYNGDESDDEDTSTHHAGQSVRREIRSSSRVQVSGL